MKPGAWAEPLRAITLSTLVGLVTRGFVRSVDYTAALKNSAAGGEIPHLGCLKIRLFRRLLTVLFFEMSSGHYISAAFGRHGCYVCFDENATYFDTLGFTVILSLRRPETERAGES